MQADRSFILPVTRHITIVVHVGFLDSQKDTLHQEGVIAEEFPELPGQEDMDLQVHVAPTLLRQTFCQMWPQEDLQYGSLSVLTITLHADHDMSTWSPEVEEEREKLTEHSVIACQVVNGPYWSNLTGQGLNRVERWNPVGRNCAAD